MKTALRIRILLISPLRKTNWILEYSKYKRTDEPISFTVNYAYSQLV